MKIKPQKLVKSGASALALSVALGVSVPAVAQDWSGPYVGLASGISIATIDGKYGIIGDFEGWVEFDDALVGGQFGAFVGYNWQKNDIVYGVEADVGWGSLSGGASEQEPPGGSEDLTGGVDAEIAGFLSVRGRLGVATGNKFIYATAGMSYLQANFDIFDSDENGSRSASGIVPVIGVGAEMMVGNNLVIGIEGLAYLASKLEVSDFSSIGSTGYTDDFFNAGTPVSVRLRMSYNF